MGRPIVSGYVPLKQQRLAEEKSCCEENDNSQQREKKINLGIFHHYMCMGFQLS
jgi:hypothetical protein